MLCLGVDAATPKEVKDLKALAYSSGLRKVNSWNVSAILSQSNGLAIRSNKGWELTIKGQERVAAIAGNLVNRPAQKIANELRGHLSKIQNKQTLSFVDEAIQCYEMKHYRAAVVLTWVGALSVLYDYVLNHRLKEFNDEIKKRNPKWKDAKTRDDLTNLKEYEFLQVINSISIIGKSVKDELEGCLKLRNGCGHPNSLRLGEARVSGHIETLILNVFSVF